MWYSSVMPQCSNQRTSERAQLLSAMTHPSTVLDLDAKQSFVTPKSYIYIYINHKNIKCCVDGFSKQEVNNRTQMKR